jgi:hypothetical protein
MVREPARPVLNNPKISIKASCKEDDHRFFGIFISSTYKLPDTYVNEGHLESELCMLPRMLITESKTIPRFSSSGNFTFIGGNFFLLW